jgi:hypothetical protein
MAREQTNGGPQDGRQAAEQFADAVRDEAVRFFNAVLEEARRNPEAFRLVPEPLTEEEAARVAGEAVHEVRRTAAGVAGSIVRPSPPRKLGSGSGAVRSAAGARATGRFERAAGRPRHRRRHSRSDR